MSDPDGKTEIASDTSRSSPRGRRFLRDLKLSPFIVDVAWSGATSLLVGVATVLAIRWIAGALGVQGFGAFSVARQIVLVSTPLTTVSMNVAIARHVAITESPTVQRQYLAAGVVIGCSATLGLMACLVPLAGRLSQWMLDSDSFTDLFRVVAVGILGVTFSELVIGFYRGKGWFARANIWRLIASGLGPIVAMVAVTIRPSATVALLFLSLPPLLALIPLAAFAGPHLSPKQFSQHARQLARYGIPRAPGGLILASMMAAGTLVAPQIAPISAAAFLAVGQFMLASLESIVGPFGFVVLPHAARLLKEGRSEFVAARITDLVANVWDTGLFIGGHAAIWMDVILVSWLGSEFRDATPVVRIVLLSSVPFMAYVVLRSVVDAVDQRALNTRNLILGLAVLLSGISIVILLHLGIIGLAIAQALGFWTLGIGTVVSLWRRGWIEAHALKLSASLLLNVGLVVVSLAARLVLTTHTRGHLLLGSAVAIELSVLVFYLLVLHRQRRPWLVELEGRLWI